MRFGHATTSCRISVASKMVTTMYALDVAAAIERGRPCNPRK